MSSPVVLITGALTGIGRATAVAFAKEGASIVASGRREAEGKALEAELRSLGAEAAFIRADVRHDDEVRNLVDQTVARFGRIDSAVNAAGTEGQPGPLIDQSSESYAATFDTNVLGTLLSLKHELRVMQAQGHGSIINISSTYGHEGAAGAAVYAASKHAVEGRAGSDRDRHAQSLHRNRGAESRARQDRAPRPCRRTGRDRARRRLSRFREGIIHHRASPYC